MVNPQILFKQKTNFNAFGESPRQSKVKINSCRVFLPLNSIPTSKNTTVSPKVISLSEGNSSFDIFSKKQDFQFFYGLCSTTFALESNLKNYKNAKFLTSLSSKKITLFTGTSKNDKDLASLKLLYFYNFSFLLQSYSNLFSSRAKNISIDTKVFTGLLSLRRAPAKSLSRTNPNVWTLRRIFRKLQAVDGLVGNSKVFYPKLLETWFIYKHLPVLYTNIKENQYYYYLRRFLDKNGDLRVSSDVAVDANYDNLLTLLSLHKSQKYRLAGLKNVLRQPLRRRTSRWALLPRSFRKEKQHQVFLNGLAESNKSLDTESNPPVLDKNESN